MRGGVDGVAWTHAEGDAQHAMKALIYGVSGQDGSYLAKLLLGKGYEVWGGTRDAFAGSRENLRRLGIADDVRILSTTLTDFRSVLTSLDQAAPDEIYNLAGQSSVSLSFEAPVETLQSISFGVQTLLECVRYRGAKTKFYNASSSECFGNVGQVRAGEETPFRPKSPYGVAKAAAHWQVVNYREAYGLFACNGILFNHESPLRPARFVTRKVIRAVAAIAAGSKEKLRLGNTSIVRDWGWAPEYVDAMWRMLQQPEPRDFVIATGESWSLDAFVQAAFEAAGVDSGGYLETDKGMLRPSEIEYSLADVSRAAEVLGWTAQHKMKDVVRMLLQAEMAGM